MKPAEPSTPSRRKGFPWGTVLRLTAAAALFAVVLLFVPIRDQLNWPAQFPDGPLPVQIRAGDGGSLLLEAAHGTRVTLFPTPTSELEGLDAEAQGQQHWSRVIIERSGHERVDRELSPEERRDLVEQPTFGVASTLKRLRPGPLIFALVLYVLAAMISFYRWGMLLHAVNVKAGFWRVQKLGFLGLFFSNIIPGMTGGDLVKAIYVARDHRGQRAPAILSVIVDRAIGLFGLALVGSAVLWFKLDEFGDIALYVNGVVLAMALAACMLFSRRLRKALRLDAILARLPMSGLLQKIDESVLLYRFAGRQIFWAVMLSILVHSIILTAIGVVGIGLGVSIPFVSYYALSPLVLIIQSVPLAPGGVGVGEAAYVYFFSEAAGLMTKSVALAVALSYRAVQIAISLVGGVLLLFGNERRLSESELQGAEAAVLRPDPPADPSGNEAPEAQPSDAAR